jgi:two-component system, NarL family, sensor kinase
LYKTLGDFRRSVAFGLRSLHVRENAMPVDSAEIGKAWMALGSTYEVMGQMERARTHYQAARRCFETAGLSRELAGVLNNLGNVAEYEGDYKAALENYRQSYSVRMVAYDTLEAVHTLRNIAKIYRATGEFSRAQAELFNAMDLAEGIENRMIRLMMEADLAELQLWEGNPEVARMRLQQLLPQLDSFAGPPMRIYAREILGLALAGLQDWPAAASITNASMRLRHQLDLSINASLYQYDQYLVTQRENERIKAASYRLQRDLEKERGQIRVLWLCIAILVLVLFGAWLYIKLLRARKKQAEINLALERNQREKEQLEQKQKVEFLQIALEVEDRERERIAHDLHDRIGAQLSVFKQLVGRMRDEAAQMTSGTSFGWEQLSNGLQTLVGEVRAVSHDLDSPTLRQFGLVEAIRGLQDMFASTPGFEFELDVHGLTERLDYRLEKHLYLVVKELFSNAVHHGQASIFSVQMFQVEDVLHLVVEDNGLGFDPQSTDRPTGLGLQSMAKRMEAIHGKYHIDSAIGRGTIITLEIPLIERT